MTPKTFSDTLHYYRTHMKEIEAKDHPPIRIALLSASTTQGLSETIAVHCHAMGLRAEVYVGPYNQIAQEILSPKSGLYVFKPEILFLVSSMRGALGELLLCPYGSTDESRKEWVRSKIRETEDLIETLKGSSAKLVVFNFEVPTASPLGILEQKEHFGLHKMVREHNERLFELYRDDPQVFVFDYESFLSDIGKQRALDLKLYYFGDITLDPAHYPALAERLMAYVRALKSLTKKCLVVDLDNTLWGGIIGEDGVGGIKLGPTPEGRPFWQLQQYILSLSERGVVLAVNSKNNFADVREVFEKHPHQILKEKHFASLQINWDDKAMNLRRIAGEIGIGIDSLLYLDDNPAERAIVQSALPEVSVIELPEDPAYFLAVLQHTNFFDSFSLSAEDRERSEMYATERKRRTLEKSTATLDDYLKQLGTVVTIRKASSATIARIAQLTQKTNQFNTTTRRRTEEEIKKLASSKSALVLSADVKDNFGESGLTGVAIVEIGKDAWHIDVFLLSCRVIGRGVEEGLLFALVKRAKRAGAKKIIGAFIPTPKNAPAKDFYERCGFKKAGNDGEIELWEYSLVKDLKPPKTITVKEA